MQIPMDRLHLLASSLKAAKLLYATAKILAEKAKDAESRCREMIISELGEREGHLFLQMMTETRSANRLAAAATNNFNESLKKTNEEPLNAEA